MPDETGLDVVVRMLYEMLEQDARNAAAILQQFGDHVEQTSKRMESSFNGAGRAFEVMAGGLRKLAGGVGATLGGIFVGAIQHSSTLQENMRQLHVIVAASHADWEVAQARILEASRAMVQMGFSTNETTASIKQAMERGLDYEQSIKLTTEASKLAAATGKDQREVVADLTAVTFGYTRPLRSLLGLNLDQIKHLHTMNDLYAIIDKRFTDTGGVDSFQQRLKILNATIGEFLDQIGTPLLGPLTDFVKHLTELTQKVQEFAKNLTPLQIQLIALGSALIGLGPGLQFLKSIFATTPIVGPLIGKIQELYMGLGGLVPMAQQFGKAMGEATDKIPTQASQLGEAASATKGVGQAARTAASDYVNMAGGAAQAAGGVKQLIQNESGHVASAKMAETALKGMGTAAAETGGKVRTLGAWIVDFIKGATGLALIPMAWQAIRGAVVAAGEAITGTMVAFLVANPVIAGIIASLALLATAYATNFAGMRDATNGTVNKIIGYLKNWDQVRADVLDGWIKFQDQFKGISIAVAVSQDVVRDGFKALGNYLATEFELKKTNFNNGLGEMKEHLKVVADAIDGAKTSAGKLGESLADLINEKFPGLATAIQTAIGHVHELEAAFGGAATAAGTWLNTMINKYFPGLVNSVNTHTKAETDAYNKQKAHNEFVQGQLQQQADMNKQLAVQREDESRRAGVAPVKPGDIKIPTTGHPAHVDAVKKLHEQYQQLINDEKERYRVGLDTEAQVVAAYKKEINDKKLVGREGDLYRRQAQVELSAFLTANREREIADVKEMVRAEEITQDEGNRRIQAIITEALRNTDIKWQDHFKFIKAAQESTTETEKAHAEILKTGVSEGLQHINQLREEGNLTLDQQLSMYQGLVGWIEAAAVSEKERVAILKTVTDEMAKQAAADLVAGQKAQNEAIKERGRLEQQLTVEAAEAHGDRLGAERAREDERAGGMVQRIQDNLTAQINAAEKIRDANILDHQKALDTQAQADRDAVANRQMTQTEYLERQKARELDMTAFTVNQKNIANDAINQANNAAEAMYTSVVQTHVLKRTQIELEGRARALDDLKSYAGESSVVYRGMLNQLLEDTRKYLGETSDLYKKLLKEKQDLDAKDAQESSNRIQKFAGKDIELQIRLLKELRAHYVAMGKEGVEAVRQIDTELRKLNDQYQDQHLPLLERLINATEDWADSMDSAFESIIDGTKSVGNAFRDLAKSLLKDLSKQAVAFATQPLKDWLFNVLGKWKESAYGKGLTDVAMPGQPGGAFGSLLRGFGALAPWAKGAIAATPEATIKAASSTFNTASGTFSKAVDKFATAISKGGKKEEAKGAGAGATGADVMSDVVSGIKEFLPGTAGKFLDLLMAFVPAHQFGGFVRGPSPLPGGAIPILAHEGEYVGRPGRGMPAGMMPGGTTVHMNPSLNLTISAIDTQSGAEFAMKNAKPMADAMMLAMRDNHMFRRMMNAPR